MKEISKTLYKLNKRRSVQYYKVIARKIEDGAVLITRKGLLHGAQQEDIEPIYPRNVGRANETTPWAQAQMRLNSTILKKMDKGYKDLGPAERVESYPLSQLIEFLDKMLGTDPNGRYIPMLAQKDISKITFPGFIQRKFDGMRGLTKEELNTKLLRSRNGKLISNLDHILRDLPPLPQGAEYDGELYRHGMSVRQIVSRVKRTQPENSLIKYRVYDLIMPGVPYIKRKKILNRLLKDAGPSISKVKTYKVKNMEEIITYFNRFREEGFEGAMWRDPQGLYEPGERSWGLIKVKDFKEEDFTIIGGKEATGRDIGTAIFKCITDKGVEFDVRPIGSREIRREYWENLEDYIGKKLTVRFQEWTEKGKPFHQRGIIIRDYED